MLSYSQQCRISLFFHNETGTDLEAVNNEAIEGEEDARPERQGGSQQVSPLSVIVRCGNPIITIIFSCFTVVFGGHFVDITFYLHLLVY